MTTLLVFAVIIIVLGGILTFVRGGVDLETDKPKYN